MTDEELVLFMRKVNVTDYCWIWEGGLETKGYGRFNIRGRSLKAHRLSYEHFIGLIPEKHSIHHICNNPGCVNPSHLQAVTEKEHSKSKIKEFCTRGHKKEINKHGMWVCKKM